MFKVGELIVHEEHGVCKIDDICDKEFGGKIRTYYELHPIDNTDLKISMPINNDKVVMIRLVDKEEAKEVLQTFNEPGIEWISDVKIRNKEYNNIIRSANRTDISKVVNTLMKKKHEASVDRKSFAEQDKKLLKKTQQILFEELALALDTTFEDIDDQIKQMLNIAS
ncbi:CarD family transcriptional regulator [Ornithinibacillus halotolerans]|uniref:CarD-like/TRCF RNAP-interacting domain-containing protein n=1 Tax=Ornithinibacillus halotolerans TaxID=1274357 RepID=A0A916W864_9BACI|nr:CarD family transcriptional regulator [Ornithinibacillus halotolerans]GGA74504.1 hypothetical protein GCM10008025_17800 [Ornithinibacillus halotolerans]